MSRTYLVRSALFVPILLVIANPAAVLAQNIPPKAQDSPLERQASREWRDLAQSYRGKIDELREKRRASGEKAQAIDAKIRAMDWAKVSEQSKQDFDENMGEVAEGLVDAFTEYMSGPGKRENVLDAGLTILTDVIPSLEGSLEAAYAPVNFEYEIDELRRDSAQYEREVAQFDRKIKEFEREIELSEKMASLYEQDQKVAAAERREIVFRLVDTSKEARTTSEKRVEARKQRIAEEERRKREEEANKIPPGWDVCSCPADHAMYGRIIGGVRYHPNVPPCPRLP